MRTKIFAVLSLLVVLLLPVEAADTLLITEFMANNAGPLVDENGDFSDWIEIHNPGNNSVNADGWYLTDNAANLTKWRIPATNVAANGYLLVFASGKNRATPGKQLHANFSLSANGEYLGLIRPDGVTIVSQFAPAFPAQIARVSYGIPLQQTTTTLLATGAAARVYIPTNDVLGGAWIAPEFDDSGWLAVVTGVGYETDASGPFVPMTIADSVSEFSGQQGSNNWYYGYWDRRADPNGIYSDLDLTFFPNANEAFGSNNFWNGTAWTWFNGNPPFTQLTAQGGTPNASNGVPTRADHWAVRRYVSEVAGPVTITGNLTHNSDWVYVTATGVAANSLLYVYLTAAGDGYIDDMKLVLGSVAEAGPNLLPNGDFESALTGPWTVSANHAASAIVTSVKHGGSSSLHLVADAGGTTQGSAIWQTISPALDTTMTYTLSYWFKPGNSPVAPLTVRFSGSWISTTPPTTCGDGVLGRIFVDGTEVFQQAAYGSSNNYSLTTRVNLGSRIDFVLDPRANDFCDSAAFTAHVETADPGNLTPLIASNIQGAMKDVNSCAYLRIPFVVSNPAEISFLSLNMKYDDGFVAYLNGVNVASRNAIDIQNPLAWNSVATANRVDSDVNVFSSIDITSFQGLLHAGTNVLAIHGLNASAGDSDFLILPVLQALTIVSGTNGAYFTTPTPGAANGLGSTNIGPIISDAAHTPNVPQDNDTLTVTALVSPTFYAISNVQMIYRVAFSNEVTVPMFDDGLHGDGAAGDHVYGAVIPASAANPGQMIRYYISATDTRTNRTRMPLFDNVVASPTYNALDAPQYFGTMVYLPQTNSLPLFHWFIASPTAADSDTGTRCSFFYNGQFFDNVGVTLHGQSSAGFPKHSYNFNLNSGYKLEVASDRPKLGDFAIISTWADRSHLRVPLNTEIYTNAGVRAHYTFPLRVQQNETFFCVTTFSEQGNDKYLERIGNDPDGALYKMYTSFDSNIAANEKKTRKYEGNADLQAFYNGIIVGGSTALTYIYDNVNLPATVNFLAQKTVSSDHDCCHKNYYFFRDTNKSGEWSALPWDFDLSLAHVWTANNGGYFDDTTYTNLFVGVGNNNTLFSLMWNDPTLKAMWMRRTRTLMDQLLQPAGTATNADNLRARIDYFANLVRADATLDKVKWGGASWNVPIDGPANPTTANPTNNFEIELSRMKDYYLPGRRTFLAMPATMTLYGIPNAQPTNLFITIGTIEYNPANANQAQEYIELINTNSIAVDLTGWRLKGAIDFAFPPGTTVSALAAGVTNRIYVSPEVKAFRARTTGPRGGQRLQVVGGYSGQLSARGETLVLVNPAGQTNASLTYVGAPSLAQQYLRITEIMYHPPAPGVGSLYDRE